jgi:dimethylargininase
MRIAITREVSLSIGRCELTHLAREAIDVELARVQHRQYEACLAALGCQIHRLPPEPELPDAVFVEDMALVLDELAIITRPGADSRRPETRSVAQALASYRRLAYIEAPGTLDGGDVLRIGQTLWVGLSGRSNPAGMEQMRAWLAPLGYSVRGVPVNGCLHLKSAVTQVARNTLLINPAWVDASAWGPMNLIEVDPSEPFAANALLVGESVVYPAAYPATRRRLEERGIPVRLVDVSELGKAEGGVTCCSVIFTSADGFSPLIFFMRFSHRFL